MPSTRPFASATPAPSRPGYRPPSRRSNRSRWPPRQVRHGPATAPMWPKLACRWPDGSRPAANTTSPTRTLPVASPSRAIGVAPLRSANDTAARSVAGSMPRTVPSTCSPSGNTSATRLARHNAEALATATPARHTTPAPRKRRASTPTTDAETRSTASASCPGSRSLFISMPHRLQCLASSASRRRCASANRRGAPCPFGQVLPI